MPSCMLIQALIHRHYRYQQSCMSCIQAVHLHPAVQPDAALQQQNSHFKPNPCNSCINYLIILLLKTLS